MSDYLNNLLSRARSLAPVVQPRPASLFEPSGVASGLPTRPAFETETQGDAPHEMAEVSHEIAPPAPPPANQPASHSAQATIISPAPLLTQKQSDEGASAESRDASGSSHIKPTAETTPASQTVTSQQFSASSEAEAKPLTNPRALSDLQRPPQPSPASTERVASAPAAEVSDDENWSRLEPKVRQVAREQLSALKPSGAHERDEATAQPAATRKAPTPYALSTAQDNRPQKRSQPFASHDEAAEPLPSINVTIGRVEVRAIISQPSAQPAPRPAEQRAAPSLDDYLKQRSGGRYR